MAARSPPLGARFPEWGKGQDFLVCSRAVFGHLVPVRRLAPSAGWPSPASPLTLNDPQLCAPEELGPVRVCVPDVLLFPHPRGGPAVSGRRPRARMPPSLAGPIYGFHLRVSGKAGLWPWASFVPSVSLRLCDSGQVA